MTAEVARASCFQCRASKRRCDRTLPVCQLCRRRAAECRYPRRRGQRSASPQEDVAIRHGHATTAAAQAGQQTAPLAAFTAAATVRFLAPDLFSELRLQIPRPEWDLPADMAPHLGDRQQMHDVTVTFLRLTRPWMPVISGRRHLAAVLSPLLTPLSRPRVLLALCMKLCCLSVDDKSRDRGMPPLYLVVKRFYGEVEGMEEPCVEVMQAALFIAVYEMGEGFYPAAYLTVGALIRYGMAMGIDKINVERMGVVLGPMPMSGSSWQDMEEMRRVWWGALILERLLDTSHPSRRSISADPVFEDFLPVDDDSFYDATSKPEDAMRISEAFALKMGSFARLCQATYLISKVLAITRKPSHDSRDSTPSSSTENAQLCRTLEALVRANELEVTTRKLAFCSQSTVSYVGVMLLQEHHWASTRLEPPQGARENTFAETHSALETLHRISTSLRDAGKDGQRDLQGNQCTLFFVNLLYRALLVLMTIGRAQNETDNQNKKESLKWLLSHTRKRWPVAGVYESIVAAKEAMIVVEASV